VKLHIFNYRYAEEILQHPKHAPAWDEIRDTLQNAPLFVFPGKSKNPRLSVVQQVMNTYFDRRFGVDLSWEYHPYATKIPNSNLRADFRKVFSGLSVQMEVQLGNMARWYSDIFKFQAAYSEQLIQVGVSVVPVTSLARTIDENVANFERAQRELPSARLSITLPILLVGLEPDETTPVIDVSRTRFRAVKRVTGKGYSDNRWRIVNGIIAGVSLADIGEDSEVGPTLGPDISELEDGSQTPSPESD
jgi:hypothetical protein